MKRSLGFTLYEMVVAILLLGIALHPVMGTLSSTTRISTDRQARLDAERIVSNEVALLAAADPEAVPSEREYRADRTGRARSDGTFRVQVRRSVRCAAETPGHLAPDACPSGAVLSDYEVTVTFPSSAGAAGDRSVTRSLAVSWGGVHGGGLGGLP
jgi:prepilin-type N-terminal cleavage/methylation domain-containing protein